YGDMPDLTLACDPRAAVSLVDSSPSPPMTQFSGRRESWAPLNLIHNRELAPHACEVANRSCELLLTRPEIARCDAKDVGAAFARLPGVQEATGAYTHFGMAVGNRTVVWRDGEAVVFDDTYIHTCGTRGRRRGTC
ncbi:unnamed protein product, partial [Prorocentrum cordatum]